MSITYHRKSNHGPFTCLYDQEEWPCETVKANDKYCDELLRELEGVVGIGPTSAGIIFAVKRAMKNLSPME